MNELIDFLKTYKLIHTSKGEFYFEPKELKEDNE